MKDETQSYIYILTHSSYTGWIYFLSGTVLGGLLTSFKIENDILNIIAGFLIGASIYELVQSLRGKKRTIAVNQNPAKITFFCLLLVHVFLLLKGIY